MVLMIITFRDFEPKDDVFILAALLAALIFLHSLSDLLSSIAGYQRCLTSLVFAPAWSMSW
jgi:hypothetical protein